MVIALSQLNFTIGDFIQNTEKIISTIRNAHANGADLIVFPELSIGGFPAFDLNYSASFRLKAQASLQDIINSCKGIACLIGGVKEDVKDEHHRIYNAAYFIKEGNVESTITKRHLLSADWFAESRYFETGDGPTRLIQVKDKHFLVAIGGDIAHINEQTKGHIDGIININAAPFSYLSHSERVKHLQQVSKTFHVPVLEVNQTGAQGDLIFDGGSMVIEGNGEVLDTLSRFAEDLRLYQSDGSLRALQPKQVSVDYDETSLIHDALLLGISDFFKKQGFSKALIGLSGGLDSALVAALACKALGAENVLGVLMPSIYSSDHSVKDALDLVKNLGCKHEVIAIKNGVQAIENMLSPVFQGLEDDLTEENIQARIRAITIMAISNKLGLIVLNTSNKSEASVGYGTLYGDLVGSLCVIGDVYKTQAYALARYINRDQEIIPDHILTKAPSAELRPGQKDSDSLPEYNELDPILFHHIDHGRSAAEIVALGFEADLVNRVIQLVNRAEFKRWQAPPILRISEKAFGRARIIPLVSKME